MWVGRRPNSDMEHLRRWARVRRFAHVVGKCAIVLRCSLHGVPVLLRVCLRHLPVEHVTPSTLDAWTSFQEVGQVVASSPDGLALSSGNDGLRLAALGATGMVRHRPGRAWMRFVLRLHKPARGALGMDTDAWFHPYAQTNVGRWAFVRAGDYPWFRAGVREYALCVAGDTITLLRRVSIWSLASPHPPIDDGPMELY